MEALNIKLAEAGALTPLGTSDKELANHYAHLYSRHRSVATIRLGANGTRAADLSNISRNTAYKAKSG